MSDLWTILIPILLTDILNPVLFAFMVYAAGTDRPVLNSSSMLAGHTLAYLVVGIVLAGWLDPLINRLNNPQRIDFFIEISLGTILIGLAIPSRMNTGKRPAENPPNPGPVSSFVTGVVINFVGIPFAVPYFAALAQIGQEDLSQAQVVGMLAAYNALYALPFTVVPILRGVMGESAKPLLERINGVIERISGVLMPILLGLIGLALVVDSTTYFVTGESFF